MYVKQKSDYLCPVCEPLELAVESFICDSANQSMDVGMESMMEDPLTWIL